MCEWRDVKQSGEGYAACVLTAFKSGCLRTALSSPPPRTFTNSMFFSPAPNIFLGRRPIKVVKEAKFLGLILDTKLTFKNHVQYRKSSCKKALDILRVVGHTDWGADQIILQRLYHALVRYRLDYGCIVYGSARRSILKQLDPIHHQGLHIVLGTFHTA